MSGIKLEEKDKEKVTDTHTNYFRNLTTKLAYGHARVHSPQISGTDPRTVIGSHLLKSSRRCRGHGLPGPIREVSLRRAIAVRNQEPTSKPSRRIGQCVRAINCDDIYVWIQLWDRINLDQSPVFCAANVITIDLQSICIIPKHLRSVHGRRLGEEIVDIRSHKNLSTDSGLPVG